MTFVEDPQCPEQVRIKSVKIMSVMNTFDPIEELYDLYSDKEETPQITEVLDGRGRLDLDLENRPLDLYLRL